MVEIRRGRPRSESSRRAILEAASALIAELGYDAMTIEAIAERAGAGRQTIYRWWPSRAAIVADAVLAGQLRLPSISVLDTGSLREDLKAWVVATGGATADPLVGQVVRALAAAASDGAREAELLYEHVTGPHYRALVERLEAGKRAGQVREGTDTLAVADALIGTVLFQILNRHLSLKRLLGIVDVLVSA